MEKVYHISLKNRKKFIGIILVIPTVLLLACFFFYPIVRAFIMSFFAVKIGKEEIFVGIQNYQKIFGSSTFWNSFLITIKYTFIAVTLEIFFGFILALAVNYRNKAVEIIRGIFIIPLVLPTPIVALIWMYMYQPNYGIINSVLRSIGLISKTIPFLNLPSVALYAVMVAGLTWVSFLVMFMLHAGLQAIPQEIYDAAIVDGANSWQKFWRITLPLMKPTLTFVIIYRIIELLQAFTLFYMMTRGGPAHSTEVLGINIFVEAFTKNNFGMAAALSFVLFFFILIFTIIYNLLIKTSYE